ncbi:MAG: helix-turn-helix domain-containing protein [bacterium]
MSTLLSADDAANALGVKASWLLKAARLREVPHYRLGKFVRFDLDEVRASLGCPAKSAPAVLETPEKSSADSRIVNQRVSRNSRTAKPVLQSVPKPVPAASHAKERTSAAGKHSAPPPKTSTEAGK